MLETWHISISYMYYWFTFLHTSNNSLWYTWEHFTLWKELSL